MFGQSTSESNFRLFWGVRWCTPPVDFSHALLTDLAELLVSRNIATAEEPHYVRWGYTDHIPYSEAFLRRMHSDRNAFVEEIAAEVWDLFLEARPMLERLNAVARQPHPLDCA